MNGIHFVRHEGIFADWWHNAVDMEIQKEASWKTCNLRKCVSGAEHVLGEREREREGALAIPLSRMPEPVAEFATQAFQSHASGTSSDGFNNQIDSLRFQLSCPSASSLVHGHVICQDTQQRVLTGLRNLCPCVVLACLHVTQGGEF